MLAPQGQVNQFWVGSGSSSQKMAPEKKLQAQDTFVYTLTGLKGYPADPFALVKDGNTSRSGHCPW
jgi:hypothetical protein